jgi:hypothetical protein
VRQQRTTNCVQVDPNTLDPELQHRVELLQTVTRQYRDAFLEHDLMSNSWDEYSRQVAAIRKLSPQQLSKVARVDALYFDFSPALNAQLKACGGNDAVLELQSTNGSLSGERFNTCYRSVLAASELQPLRARTGTYFLVADVFGIQPLPNPAKPEPKPEPKKPVVTAEQREQAELEAAESAEAQLTPEEREERRLAQQPVRDWLDAAAPDILACAGLPRLVVKVAIDEEGAALIQLRGERGGPPEEDCVREAAGTKTFEGGPLDIVHLVKPATPNDEDSPSKGGE